MGTTPTDRHIDTALTNVSVAYMQNATNFIASSVFPTIPVAHLSNKYFVYNRDAFFRTNSTLRAPATASAGTNLQLGQDNYYCDVYSVHTAVSDQEIANADAQVDPLVDAAELVMNDLLIAREQQFADSFFKTGVWENEKDLSSTQWDDDANSDPSNDIKDGILAIQESTGRRPNALTLDVKTYEVLKRHPLIVDRIKYTNGSTAPVNRNAIAAYLDLDNIFVSSAIRATSVEGASTLTTEFILDKRALLTYTPPSAGLRIPSAGYIFSWAGYTGLNNAGIAINRWYEDRLASEMVEASMAYDMKVVAPQAGYLLTNTIS